MSRGLVAQASARITASRDEVWEALTRPELIRQYFFGTTLATSWRVGEPITWKGEWQGKAYEDKGTILRMDPGRRIEYSHFSPMTGKPDEAENYHTVTIELAGDGSSTVVTLSQDNNPTAEARQHAEENWRMVLDGLKKLLEG